jgi:hypothetical protein
MKMAQPVANLAYMKDMLFDRIRQDARRLIGGFRAVREVRPAV